MCLFMCSARWSEREKHLRRENGNEDLAVGSEKIEIKYFNITTLFSYSYSPELRDVLAVRKTSPTKRLTSIVFSKFLNTFWLLLINNPHSTVCSTLCTRRSLFNPLTSTPFHRSFLDPHSSLHLTCHFDELICLHKRWSLLSA